MNTNTLSDISSSQFIRTAQLSHLRSHIAGAADHLINESDELRKCSSEQILYDEYVKAGSPHGSVLYAVKGEHWNGVSPAFLEFLNNFTFTREMMGYAECGYGIQRHRNFMRNLIVREHKLDGIGFDIDVGCLAMTTRMAMYDLAKMRFVIPERCIQTRDQWRLYLHPRGIIGAFLRMLVSKLSIFLFVQSTGGFLIWTNGPRWSRILKTVVTTI